MDPYQKPYLSLFNAVTDALAAMEVMNFGLGFAMTNEICQSGFQKNFRAFLLPQVLAESGSIC